MITKDIRELRNNLSQYIDQYRGKKVYISKYNKLIGEIKFYTHKEKEKIMLAMAKEMLKNDNVQFNLFS
ncbi:MAG: hypothetical protein PHN32_06105 [Actinomycetota bacterium]|jgi:antitoxin (DNA-binding transcriptional repressor) of toxin-antitoxin stability system|nr:hypothetical protein [Actinomycetota bacterium]